MGKIKYLKTLPDQLYLFKNFTTLPSKEGTMCDECGAYIVNVVTVVGSVDHVEYHLGSTCCEKASKGLKNINLDDKVAVQVKFWKGRLAKLAKFRKSFNKELERNPISIQGQFLYDSRKKCALIDFGFLFDNGDWRWMHEDFPITKIYSKVKETFADVWDKIEWLNEGVDLASMETSADVYKALTTGASKVHEWNDYCDKHYPEWSKKNEIRHALQQSTSYSNGWGEGKKVQLPSWFNIHDYSEDMFEMIVRDYAKGYVDFDKSIFVLNDKTEVTIKD